MTQTPAAGLKQVKKVFFLFLLPFFMYRSEFYLFINLCYFFKKIPFIASLNILNSDPHKL